MRLTDAQIKYVPGKDIPVADALSRISSCYGEAVQGLDVSVHEVHLHLNASPMRVSQIREETDKDTTLSALHEIIILGPRCINTWYHNATCYFPFRHRLMLLKVCVLSSFVMHLLHKKTTTTTKALIVLVK